MKITCISRALLLCAVVAFYSQLFVQSAFAVDFTEREIALLEAFGPWPVNTPPDPGNEYSGVAWAEQMGEVLFHNTDLSQNQAISCATCHQSALGFSENRPVAVANETHVRNTQGLLNVGLQRWFGWDGGADSLWAASLRPMLSTVEMNATVETVAVRMRKNEAFVNTLHQNDISINELNDEKLVVLIAKSIGAYQRTLVSGTTAFDLFRMGLLSNDEIGLSAYTESEKRGLKLFLGSANCHVCHFGPNFSNGEFHDIGRSFFTAVGQVDGGRYAGIKRVRQDHYNLVGPFSSGNNPDDARKTETVTLGQVNFGQWRTPTLRNLSLTGPYMHDGSLATLRDVVDFYAEIDTTRLHAQGETLLNPQRWSDADRNDLVNFLMSLSNVVGK